MNLIILGPQGSGKGTQAKLLAEKYHLKHISTGELLRAEAESGSALGKEIDVTIRAGNLVPFNILSGILETAMRNAEHGFILDGTPRDKSQAEYLDNFLSQNNIKIDAVVLLDIPREVSLDRLVKRAAIEHRADDTLEVINERLNIYENKTLPVVEKYRQEGRLLVIDGTPDIDTIFQDICHKLDSDVKYAV